MCEEMKEGNWTIERDEDLTAPYAFMNKTWMSFDDSVSVSIKACISIVINFDFSESYFNYKCNNRANTYCYEI